MALPVRTAFLPLLAMSLDVSTVARLFQRLSDGERETGWDSTLPFDMAWAYGRFLGVTGVTGG